MFLCMQIFFKPLSPIDKWAEMTDFLPHLSDISDPSDLLLWVVGSNILLLLCNRIKKEEI